MGDNEQHIVLIGHVSSTMPTEEEDSPNNAACCSSTGGLGLGVPGSDKVEAKRQIVGRVFKNTQGLTNLLSICFFLKKNLTERGENIYTLAGKK